MLLFVCFIVLNAFYCAGGNWEDIFDETNEFQRVFYVDGSGYRMVEAVYVVYPEHTLSDCYVYGDRLFIQQTLRNVSEERVLLISRRTMKKLMHHCSNAKRMGVLPSKSPFSLDKQFGMFSGIFIYPGTKWCGAGNISEGYDDLGPEVEADMCCRDHDHCNDSIPGRESRHGLKNKSQVTKSHCDCDTQFYECLQKANTKVSNRLGKIYFNVLCMECFKKEHPIISCRDYAGRWPFKTCQKYNLDTDKDPIWQFFDPKRYVTLEGGDEDDDDENDDENEVLRTHLKEWQQFSSNMHFNGDNEKNSSLNDCLNRSACT